MTVGGAYVRVYYRVLDDPQFEGIYEDDHHLATWLRLLMVADQMWPGLPPIPAGVRPASLRALTAAGLVEAMPRHCYRIRGLDAERTARRNVASYAAAKRWPSASTADAMPEHAVSNARADREQSQPNASRARTESESESETYPSSVEEGSARARAPSELQQCQTWLVTHNFSAPTGYVRDDFRALVRGYRAAAVLDAFEHSPAKTTKELVRAAERLLAGQEQGAFRSTSTRPNAGRNGRKPSADYSDWDSIMESDDELDFGVGAAPADDSEPPKGITTTRAERPEEVGA